MRATAFCRVCKAQGFTTTPGIPWTCDDCLAGERPEGDDNPGICPMEGGHHASKRYGPTKLGYLCLTHITAICKIANWPHGWP
jgi:hypothetical protein